MPTYIVIDDLAAVSSAASNDYVAIWRTANGDTRKITKADLLGAVLTGGGTIATGGFTLTVPASGIPALLATAQIFTARKGFSTSIGLSGSKASVANNSATNLCDIIIGGAGPLAATYLLGVTVTSASNSSSQIWTVAQGFSAADIDKLSEALFQHSSIVLTATASSVSRKITIGITQVNPSAQACTVSVSLVPIMINSDATITLTML